MNWTEAKKKLLEDDDARKAYEAKNWDNFLFWLGCKWTNLKIWWRKQ